MVNVRKPDLSLMALGPSSICKAIKLSRNNYIWEVVMLLVTSLQIGRSNDSKEEIHLSQDSWCIVAVCSHLEDSHKRLTPSSKAEELEHQRPFSSNSSMVPCRVSLWRDNGSSKLNPKVFLSISADSFISLPGLGSAVPAMPFYFMQRRKHGMKYVLRQPWRPRCFLWPCSFEHRPYGLTETADPRTSACLGNCRL